MTTALTTRVTAGTGATVKGTPLTNAEIDANFLSLNDNKLETSWTGNTSIVTLGTVATGTWNATTIAINKGGTGITTAPTSGTLLIGNSSGGYTSASLTGTTNRVTVTNGSGSITLSLPQDIATSSNVQFGSIGVGQAASGTSGNITATSFTETSSIVYKENIEPLHNALDTIMQLQGVSFNWKDSEDESQQIGLIAEDVDKFVPQVVSKSSSGAVIGVQYTKLVAYLIESIKDLKQEIDDLKASR